MNGGNSGGRFSMEFEAEDILVIADALSLGAATAMTYGREGKGADDRLRELADRFRSLVPVPVSRRSEGYGWFNAMRQLRQASHYEVFIKEFKASRFGGGADRTGVWMEVDGRELCINPEVDPAKAEGYREALSEFVDGIASVDAERLVRISVTVELDDDGRTRRGDDLMASVQERCEAILSQLPGGPPVHAVREAEIDWSQTRDTAAAVISVAVSGLAAAEAAFEAARRPRADETATPAP